MIRKFGLLTVLVGAAMFALAPSGSSAATTLGSTFDPDECEGDTTYIQTVSPGNSYSVPSDGVITHWTYQAHGTDGTSVKLKVGRVSPSADLTLNTDVTIVGESGLQLVPAGSLGSFSTQIPVKAGDRIGEYVNGGFTGCSISDASFTDHYNNSDVGVGTTTLFSQENFQQDISAVWEPDCDNDGRGDDSQDSDTASCHPASTTGQRAAALQRCKKKAKKNHWTKKQRKKCRKKANKLPV